MAANGHVHSVYLKEGGYHHLFNLMFMTSSEIEIIQLALSGRPIPKDMSSSAESVREAVDNIINVAVAKDHQPAQERIEPSDQIKDAKIVEEKKDDETDKEQ